MICHLCIGGWHEFCLGIVTYTHGGPTTKCECDENHDFGPCSNCGEVVTRGGAMHFDGVEFGCERKDAE